MTEYDFSDEAYAAFKEKQRGVSRWVERTQEHANEFSNPFVPPTIASSSTPPPSHSHRPRHTPRRSETAPIPRTVDPGHTARHAPQRAHTMVYPLAYPTPYQTAPYQRSASPPRHSHQTGYSNAYAPQPRFVSGAPQSSTVYVPPGHIALVTGVDPSRSSHGKRPKGQSYIAPPPLHETRVPHRDARPPLFRRLFPFSGSRGVRHL